MSRKRSASSPPACAAAAPAFSAMPVRSAPAQKALSPAPVSTTTRTSASARARHRVAQPAHHAVRHRVAALGPIDRHAGDAAGRLVQQLVVHAATTSGPRTPAIVTNRCLPALRLAGHRRIVRDLAVPSIGHARARDRRRCRAADPARDARLLQAPDRTEIHWGWLLAAGLAIQLGLEYFTMPPPVLAQRRASACSSRRTC